jgi:competence ComEA-like helix-hairpin-helix protein
MSIYRRLIVAVAAMGLATSVFAAEDAATTTTTTETTAAAPADAAPAAEATPAPAAEAKAAPAAEETTTTTTTTTASTDKLDLNKASVKELMKLKGVSAAKAKAIVTYRKKHGYFKSVEDLKEVKGFKKLNEKKMQEIADQLTVG